MTRGVDRRREEPPRGAPKAGTDTGRRTPDEGECKRCSGTGWILKKGPPDRAIRCLCWGRETTRTLLEEARIPARFKHCRLDNLQTYDNLELKNAIAHATTFAETFPKSREGLLISGPTGIGKTHIAVSVLKHVIVKRHTRGLYYDTRDLLRSIRGTYDPAAAGPQEVDVVDPVIKTDLLILDDLGAERATSWVHDMMTTIINTRYNEQRPIIATSNYENGRDGNGNGNGDAESPNSLSRRLGKATFSRLREMCDFIEYDGLDYREFAGTPDEEVLKAAWRDTQRRRHRGSRTRR